MRMGNSHNHETTVSCEATLGTRGALDEGEKQGAELSFQKPDCGLEVGEEDWSTCG